MNVTRLSNEWMKKWKKVGGAAVFSRNSGSLTGIITGAANSTGTSINRWSYEWKLRRMILNVKGQSGCELRTRKSRKLAVLEHRKLCEWNDGVGATVTEPCSYSGNNTTYRSRSITLPPVRQDVQTNRMNGQVVHVPSWTNHLQHPLLSFEDFFMLLSLLG